MNRNLMHVETSISELLYHHDCVIIPGFGAITCSHASASIHPTQHIFKPPQKTLAFDKDLASNDGLLISHFAKKFRLSLEEAERHINNFVAELHNMLQQKGNAELKNIGKFYFDIEKKMEFIPNMTTNYLLSSFGLNPFVSAPVLHPENISSYGQNTKAPTKEKKKRRFLWFRFNVMIFL